MTQDHRDFLSKLFLAGVEAADPALLVQRVVQREGSLLRCGSRRFDLASANRLIVLAFGKAAPGMMRGFAEIAGADRLEGMVATNTPVAGLPVPVLLGGHPLPNPGSVAAGEELLRIAGSASAGDLVVCLISGGGSAIVEVPARGITVDDLMRVNETLLRAGADIHQLNSVRKHLSQFKGGRLARAAGDADVVSLAISDVTGDAIDVIASGPTVPDPSTYGDALAVVARYGLTGQLPRAVIEHLEEGVAGQWPESPNELHSVETLVIGSAATAAAGVTEAAKRHGLSTEVLTTVLEGEARDEAAAMLDDAASIAADLCVSAGETTVTVTGDGRGGRNQEAALAAALHLADRDGVAFLAAGTDGIDGMTEAAGAFADPSTVVRAEARGLDAADYLRRNDSGTFFAELEEQVVTGPTGTNVGDVWLALKG